MTTLPPSPLLPQMPGSIIVVALDAPLTPLKWETDEPWWGGVIAGVFATAAVAIRLNEAVPVPTLVLDEKAFWR